MIRNTYELRLALYMAKSKGLRFVLAVKPETQVDPAFIALLREHGGEIQETRVTDCSVYFGRTGENDKEEGWVLGDLAALESLRQSVQSAWLKERLHVGAIFGGTDLEQFESALRKEPITAANIDEENVKEALLRLVAAARQEGGVLFVQ